MDKASVAGGIKCYQLLLMKWYIQEALLVIFKDTDVDDPLIKATMYIDLILVILPFQTFAILP